MTGWESFEPWLSCIESLDPQAIWEIAETAPPLWYGSSLTDLERLLDQLIERRGKVRDLIDSFRKSTREPFQNWNENVVVEAKG